MQIEETRATWHPFPAEIPPGSGFYLVTVHVFRESDVTCEDYVQIRHAQLGQKDVWGVSIPSFTVVAWAPLPAPYKEVCCEG